MKLQFGISIIDIAKLWYMEKATAERWTEVISLFENFVVIIFERATML